MYNRIVLREKIGVSIKRNKSLIENFGYLGLLQVFNLILPFVTYPYLIRVLGKELYGVIIFSQAITSFLAIMVNFGFNISATKDISSNRDNNRKLNEIVSSVLILKFVFFVISFCILFLLVLFYKKLDGYELLISLCMWICLYELVFPVWFFQGIEKMKYITIITVISRVSFTILIFIFVGSGDDYMRVPFFNGIGALMSGCIAFFIMYKYYNIRFTIPSVVSVFSCLKSSYALFLSNLVITIKDKASYIFIGNFIGVGATAEYDLAVKLKTIISMPVEIINQAIFPKVSRENNMALMKKVMVGTTAVMIVVSIIGILLSSYIVGILGGENMEQANIILRILLISIPIYSVSMFLSRNCINAKGRYGLLLQGMILTTLFYLSLVGVSVYLGLENSIISFAYITLIVYLFELFYRVFIVKKNKLL